MQKHQRGLGILGILVVLLVAGILGTAVVRIAPVFMDNWTLTNIIDGVVEEFDGGQATPAQVRTALSRRFVTNRADVLPVKDMKIKLVDNNIEIDASYEKRVPLMYNVDAVVKFEEQKFLITRK